MIEVLNITTDPFQRHIITTEDGPITLTLRFYPRAQFWTFSTEYKGIECNGFKLSLGTPHMVSSNMPFDFAVTDDGGTGIDPFSIDDFAGGRCRLFMLEKADMEVLRGQPVPI